MVYNEINIHTIYKIDEFSHEVYKVFYMEPNVTVQTLHS